MSEKTHPVYIDKERKNAVKAKAAEEDVSMKAIIQRLVDHGFELDLHKVPTGADADLDNVDVSAESVVTSESTEM